MSLTNQQIDKALEHGDDAALFGAPEQSAPVYEAPIHSGYDSELEARLRQHPSIKLNLDSSASIHSALMTSVIGKAAAECAINFNFPLETAMLLSLGVASTAVSTGYSVALTENEDASPIGLYVMGEQGSGSAKTPMMKALCKGVFAAFRNENERRSVITKQIAKSASEKKGDLTDYEAEQLEDNHYISGIIDDTTPEALDMTIAKQKGWFSLISTEQTLVDTLLVSNGDRKANKGAILKGFNAEFYSSKRVTRNGFEGFPHGSFVCVSQNGAINTVIENSGATGVLERFLLIVEDNVFGSRNHRARLESHKYSAYTQAFQARTEEIITAGVGNSKLDFEDLKKLSLSYDAACLILDVKEEVEESLADGRKYGHDTLRAVWSKFDQQVMKIAATIHVMNGKDESEQIDIETTSVAMVIVKNMLQGIISVLSEKGVMGEDAECEKILEYMQRKGSVTRESVLNAARKWSMFTSYGKDARSKAGEAFDRAVSMGLVMQAPILATTKTVRYRVA